MVHVESTLLIYILMCTYCTAEEVYEFMRNDIKTVFGKDRAFYKLCDFWLINASNNMDSISEKNTLSMLKSESFHTSLSNSIEHLFSLLFLMYAPIKLSDLLKTVAPFPVYGIFYLNPMNIHFTPNM